MEQCSQCEETFRSGHPLRLSITQSGNDILVYAQNQGRNIIIIKRMILCLTSSNSQTLLYIREGGFFDFEIGGERLEQGLTQLKFRISWSSAEQAQVQAEYFEVTNRASSCLSVFDR